MKIIVARNNVGAPTNDATLSCYLMPDSAIVRSGKPLFVPDWASQFRAQPSIVVRVGRLGKTIARRFAHRYYDAVTAGMIVTPEGDAGGLEHAFDGAAVVGDWVAMPQGDELTDVCLTAGIDDRTLWNLTMSDLHCPVDRVIEQVSEKCTLKMGDLIFLCEAAPAVPLELNTTLRGTIDGNDVLRVKVK